MIRTLLFGLLLPLQTLAFTLGSSTDTNLKGFASKTIYFMVNDSNCPSSRNVKAAVQQAINAWNEVTYSNVHLVYGGSSSSTGYSTRPIISCDTAFGTTTGADADWVAGVGSFQSSNSTITTGAIYLNAESGKNGNIQNWSNSALAALIAHEMGHVLGLGHSQDPAALMYYSISRTSLYIAQDDIDGISYLYPRDELSSDSPMGCGTISGPSQGPKNKWPILLLFALPILLALALKLRSEAKVRSV